MSWSVHPSSSLGIDVDTSSVTSNDSFDHSQSLHLNGVSSMVDTSSTMYAAVTRKIDELFFRWFTSPETLSLLHQYLDRDLWIGPAPGFSGLSENAGMSPHPGIPAAVSPPPRSPPTRNGLDESVSFVGTPQISSSSEKVEDLYPSSTGYVSTVALPKSPPSRLSKQVLTSTQSTEVIPPFYVPKKKSLSNRESDVDVLAQAKTFFQNRGNALRRTDMSELLHNVLHLPSYLSLTLFSRCLRLPDESVLRVNTVAGRQSPVSQARRTAAERPLQWDEFEKFFKNRRLGFGDVHEKCFGILRSQEPSRGSEEFLVRSDFILLIEEILDRHQGMEFLKSTPEFQERYLETVIERIFYDLERGHQGRIYLKEWKKSKFVSILEQLDEEDDINRVLEFFSYEHFYVLYCKFWELDQDHDFFISKDDFARYGNYCLTNQTVEQIFRESPRPFLSPTPDLMSYRDFVWFCLSEEDKTSPRAQEYWFNVLDLDRDGLLSVFELEVFYAEQVQRMESFGCEVVTFEDILCQMLDMVKPKNLKAIELADIRRCKQGDIFFNVFCNLSKFMSYETRDPFLVFQENQGNPLTEWQKFARIEYDRMALEDDSVDDIGGDPGEWSDGLLSQLSF